MKLILLSPAKTLLPAYRVQNVEQNRLERFKTELVRLLQHLEHSAGESEEHLKNIVADFFKAAFYRNEHFVNTKGRQDLVIHHGPTAKESVGVIIETKKPGNKAEMITPDKPNAKALHELLRYYLDERIRGENKDIRHLVVTDIHNWYLFDAADFERQVYANKKLRQQYADWAEGRLGAATTDWFYKEIAAPFFEKELPELRCCHFDLTAYAEAARNADPGDDETLLDLYKILSPGHLLKQPLANDSNTLNKQFYDELLYILGLEEVKDSGKKIIDRAGKRRHDGSLLENTLGELDVSGVWRDVQDLEQFGDTPEAQRFSIALELCITWLNRILFLKLLEAQLLRWNPGAGRLLSPELIGDFDELNELFFHVLAVPETERRASVARKFGQVPYLNSALFEQTELERRTLRISALKDRLELPLPPNTVLRDGAGQRRGGRLNTLHYLFDFLDAYDFSSDARARIQADNRDVINASVLGLIFEKINGYRDGSFFTPGFITMYMCRQTLRRAVLQKFNERYGWDCQNLETELHNELIRQRIALNDANALVNSLRICDPAVGSGHFLVSALNELIAIKSDLGILCDRAGKLLPLRALVGNDELILTDPDTDAPFEYKPGVAASQRIQEALFHEKQTLIENCLFGVDINPKSVMICRLRLWIELLKHAYFTPESQYHRLETLPNIDINIKAGNSLVSRFALDEDLKDVFAKGKIKAADYRLAVAAYKNATDKDAKKQLLDQISRVKAAIYESFYQNNPLNKKLKKLLGDRFLLENKAAVGDLFEKLKSEDISAGLDKLNRQIESLEAEIEELKQGKTYRNSFEWRFEFPEVLDNEGQYIGFDVVIGNPPYGIKFSDVETEYFKSKYIVSGRNADSYSLFIEISNSVAHKRAYVSFIVPTGWYSGTSFNMLREFFARRCDPVIFVILPYDVFIDAWVDTTIVVSKKREQLIKEWPRKDDHVVQIKIFDKKEKIDSIDDFDKKVNSLRFSSWFDAGDNNYVLSGSDEVDLLINKIRKRGISLSEFADVQRGVTPFKLSTMPEHENSRPAFNGTVRRYKFERGEKCYIRYDNSLAEYKPEKYFQGERILLRELISRQFQLQAIKTDEYFITNKSMQSIVPNKNVSVNYLLALINSKLMSWYFLSISQIAQRDDFPKIVLKETRQLPIYPIDLNSANFKSAYNKIVGLTEKIVAKQTDPQADTSALEAEVDQLVYELYRLTAEEVAIIEG